MALIDTLFHRIFQRGELTVVFPNGRVGDYGSPDTTLGHVRLRIADRKVYRQLLANPSLGLAECLMDGRIAIEQGDILQLLTMARANSRWEKSAEKYHPSASRRFLAKVFREVGRFNTGLVSKRNVAHHYDLSDRLYDLFLDSDRQYSCAYFTDADESLEQAQLDKKAHIAAKLALKPGMRVLDIGCGWGGMALYLHRKCGVDVLGITLSEEQLKVARRRAEEAGVADHVKFELIDYRDVQGPFDRIVSVGMFEHVGTPFYRTYLTKCRDLLTDTGVMLLHTIGRADGPSYTDAFTAKYIFPGGYIPALSEIVRPNEDLHWYISDVEVLRLHYGYTLQHWYDRTVAAKAQIVALYDERFYRMWTYYLAGALTAFSEGNLVNYQVQFTRDRHALPITRDYMVDEERRLHETVPDAANDRAVA